MPPVTRRAQQSSTAKGVKKAPSRKTRAKDTTDEWSLPVSKSRLPEAVETYNDEQNGALPAITNIDPLREVAEKVGREVEAFAESLDRFITHLPAFNQRFDAVLELVDEFRATAQEAVTGLEKGHQKERAQQLREEWKAHANLPDNLSNSIALAGSRPFSMTDTKAHQVEQLRKWQQEADTWELFHSILELHHNPDKRARQDQKERELAKLGTPHRYTGEGELWERFIIEDDLARERATIKEWLERSADHQHSHIPGIVEELEARAGRGKGLWTNGWMHTREKIKHEKRLRPWQSSVDQSDLPQIRTADGNDLLTAQLDPDAACRQGRSLEKTDAYFERAIWITCWEMLRRGKSWTEVSDWCEQRKEGWRATSIGRAADPLTAFSNSAWRKMCLLASQTKTSCDYEAAVYGLLGGNAAAMQKVARTVDEQLYAYYSAALTRQFDQYLFQNYPERVPYQRRTVSDDDLQNPEKTIIQHIMKLRSHNETSIESGSPIKLIQSYLLANEADSLVHTIGFGVSDASKRLETGADMYMVKLLKDSAPEAETEAAVDLQALRITAHINVILKCLRSERLEGTEQDADDNVLGGYIAALRTARKRELVPLYASQMSRDGYVWTLCQVMVDITTDQEQESMLNLFKQYDLDAVAIMRSLSTRMADSLMKMSAVPDRPLRILESTDIAPLYPGQKICEDFLPFAFDRIDNIIVRSLKWFYIIKGHWYETFEALTNVLSRCLLQGRLSTAMLIVEEFPYETVSIRKSYQVIGKSVNMMEYDTAPEDERLAWELLRRQSRTYYELGQLVTALVALSDWQKKESDYIKQSKKMSSAPPALRSAKEAVDAAVAPILHGLLLEPLDVEEAARLEEIRVKYIPEIILAYNTVLCSAGSLISRDNLVESMDLSTLIAKEGNGVVDCFIKAQRMRELVTSFAETSKAMLVLTNAGRTWKAKKGAAGKDLRMWEIGPQTDFRIDVKRDTAGH